MKNIRLKIGVGVLIVLIIIAGLTAYFVFKTPTITKPKCGNNICDINENWKNCQLDCEKPSPILGRIIQSAEIVSGPERKTSHGDLWLSTWANNDEIYMSWGDGCGPGAIINNKNCNPTTVSFTDAGIASFVGSDLNILLVASKIFRHVPSGKPPKPIGGTDRDDKPSSLLFYNDVLYWAGHSPAGDADFGYLAYSNDNGKTWKEVSKSPWTKKSGSNFRIMMFIQMGKNYELNTDGYVYALAIGKEFGWADGTYLTRVPKNSIADYSAYEYYSSSNENPAWSASQADAKPLPNIIAQGVGSAIYHDGIDRYLFLSQIAKDNPKGSYLTLFESPNPWGTWQKVAEMPLTGSWRSGYMPGIIPKDIGPDYIYFTMAGDDTGNDLPYSLNIGKIEFELNN